MPADPIGGHLSFGALMRPTEIYRNQYGWVSLEVSKELLAHIFPKYPDISVCHPLPCWIKERLKLEEK